MNLNLPLDKDWDDLPEEIQLLFTRERWERLQKSTKMALGAYQILQEASDLMARNGGDDPARWKELSGVLDAIRHARHATDNLVQTVVKDEQDFEQAKERLADHLEDIKMEMTALQGVMSTRMLTQKAYTLEHWTKQPQDTLPEGMRDLVRQWLEGERERCLSQLPIEIRRRIEAGEPPEPGDVKPL